MLEEKKNIEDISLCVCVYVHSGVSYVALLRQTMDGFAELQFFSFPFHYYFSSLREFQCLFGLCYFFQMARSESRKSLKLLRDYIADLDAVSSIIWHKYFSCSLIVRKAVRPKPIITVRSIWKLIEKKLYSRLSEFLLWLRTDCEFFFFSRLYHVIMKWTCCVASLLATSRAFSLALRARIIIYLCCPFSLLFSSLHGASATSWNW